MMEVQPQDQHAGSNGMPLLNVPGSNGGFFRIVAVTMPNKGQQQQPQAGPMQLVASGPNGLQQVQVINTAGQQPLMADARQLIQVPQQQQPLQQFTMVGQNAGQPIAVIGPNGQPMLIHPAQLSTQLQQQLQQQQQQQQQGAGQGPRITLINQQQLNAVAQLPPAVTLGQGQQLQQQQQQLQQLQQQGMVGKWEGSGEAGGQLQRSDHSDHAEECRFVEAPEPGLASSNRDVAAPHQRQQQQLQQLLQQQQLQGRAGMSAATLMSIQQQLKQQQQQQQQQQQGGAGFKDEGGAAGGRQSDPANGAQNQLQERGSGSMQGIIHLTTAPQQQQQAQQRLQAQQQQQQPLRLQFQPGLQVMQALQQQQQQVGANAVQAQRRLSDALSKPPQMQLVSLMQQHLQQQQQQQPRLSSGTLQQQLQQQQQQGGAQLLGKQLAAGQVPQVHVKAQPQDLESKQSALQMSGPSIAAHTLQQQQQQQQQAHGQVGGGTPVAGASGAPEVSAAQLHHAVETWSKRLADSEAAKEVLAQQLDKELSRNKQMVQELQQAQLERGVLQDELGQLKSRVDAFDQERLQKDAEHGIQIYEALERCKSLIAARKNLEAQLDLSSRTIAQKEKEVQKLNAELQATKRMATELNSSKQAAEQANQAASQQRASEHEQQASEHGQLVSELQAAKARCQQLEQQLREATSSPTPAGDTQSIPCGTATADAAEAMDVDAAAAAPAAGPAVKAEATDAEMAAEQQLAEDGALLMSIQQQMSAQQQMVSEARVQELEAQLAAAQEQLAAVTAELASAKQAAAAAAAPKAEAVVSEDAPKAGAEHQQALADAQAALAAAKARADDMETENMALISSSKVAIKRAQEDSLQHSRAAQEAREQVAVLQKQLGEQAAQVEELRTQVAQLQAARAQAERDAEQLKAQLEAHKTAQQQPRAPQRDQADTHLTSPNALPHAAASSPPNQSPTHGSQTTGDPTSTAALQPQHSCLSTGAQADARAARAASQSGTDLPVYAAAIPAAGGLNFGRRGAWDQRDKPDRLHSAASGTLRAASISHETSSHQPQRAHPASKHDSPPARHSADAERGRDAHTRRGEGSPRSRSRSRSRSPASRGTTDAPGQPGSGGGHPASHAGSLGSTGAAWGSSRGGSSFGNLVQAKRPAPPPPQQAGHAPGHMHSPDHLPAPHQSMMGSHGAAQHSHHHMAQHHMGRSGSVPHPPPPPFPPPTSPAAPPYANGHAPQAPANTAAPPAVGSSIGMPCSQPTYPPMPCPPWQRQGSGGPMPPSAPYPGPTGMAPPPAQPPPSLPTSYQLPPHGHWMNSAAGGGNMGSSHMGVGSATVAGGVPGPMPPPGQPAPQLPERVGPPPPPLPGAPPPPHTMQPVPPPPPPPAAPPAAYCQYA